MKPWLGAMIVAGGFALSVHAEPLQPPHNVTAEPSSPRSSEMATDAAQADMKGDPQAALKYANAGITADARDPWPYYDKAQALARLGDADAALDAYAQAERHFAATDRWGKSVAVFGRAHLLARANRCKEAQAAFNEYASLVQDQDPGAAQLAHRYAADCNAGAPR